MIAPRSSVRLSSTTGVALFVEGAIAFAREDGDSRGARAVRRSPLSAATSASSFRE